MHEVALVLDHVSVEDCPDVIDEGEAEKVTTGSVPPELYSYAPMSYAEPLGRVMPS